MAAGDHDATFRLQMVCGEIQCRCRHDTDINDVAARSTQALDKALGKFGAGEATIAPNYDGLLTGCICCTGSSAT